MRGALMVCGTGSDVGKTHVVTGLCRVLARRGVRVAPFKAQNMSLSSYVTRAGHEIGRAQAAQAFAAGVEPEVVMNPILLKPSSVTGSQVVLMGRPIGHLEADEYHARKPELLEHVLGALADLRSRFDVVLLEGAGSPAEINLLDRDIVNLSVAVAAGIDAVVVGDIDRGGVFASLYGTVALLPPEQRARVRGFVINKLRGDPALLFDGAAQLERASGVPTLGVLPWVDGVALDAEDSLALQGPPPAPLTADGRGPTAIDVAVVRFPHLANPTDVDPLALEPGVGVRFVDHAASLGDPDLVVLPGSKATLADLAWLRASGLAAALEASRSTVVGICAGYQMLGRRLADPHGVESSAAATAEGLGWLAADTTWQAEKTLRRRQGTVGAGPGTGAPVHGYEIHHGDTATDRDVVGWLCLDGALEGAIGHRPTAVGRRAVYGTSLHGVFEADELRAAVLADAHRGRRGGATRPWSPRGVSFAAARQAQVDRLGELVEQHLDLDAVERLIGGSAA